MTREAEPKIFSFACYYLSPIIHIYRLEMKHMQTLMQGGIHLYRQFCPLSVFCEREYLQGKMVNWCSAAVVPTWAHMGPHATGCSEEGGSNFTPFYIGVWFW